MKGRPVIFLAFMLLSQAGCGPQKIARQEVDNAERVKAFVLAGEGDELLREGKDHLALLKYTEASVLYPYHESIFNKLAIAYSRLQRYREARKAIQHSIGLNSKYAYAYNTRGMIQLAQLDNKGAVRSFRRAIRLLPEPPLDEQEKMWAASFYANLGFALIQRDEFNRGLEAYQTAQELSPKVFDKGSAIRLEYASPTSNNPQVQYQFSKLFANLGDKEQALYYLDRALSAGFKDSKKLLKETAFQDLRADQDFIELLERYGILLS